MVFYRPVRGRERENSKAMLAKEESSVEVQIWIKDDSVRKVFIKNALKSLLVMFTFVFLYYFYGYAFICLRFFKGNTESFPFFVFLIFIIAASVSVLYAAGSGFQEVSELEKASPKTRIIFRQSKIEFIRGFDSIEKSWTDFHKIKETVDGFRVYPNDAKSFFINHHAFQTRQDILSFRKIARTELGEKAKLRND